MIFDGPVALDPVATITHMRDRVRPGSVLRFSHSSLRIMCIVRDIQETPGPKWTLHVSALLSDEVITMTIYKRCNVAGFIRSSVAPWASLSAREFKQKVGIRATREAYPSLLGARVVRQSAPPTIGQLFAPLRHWHSGEGSVHSDDIAVATSAPHRRGPVGQWLFEPDGYAPDPVIIDSYRLFFIVHVDDDDAYVLK